MSFRKDLNDSMLSFKLFVKPYIIKWLNLKKIWSIEKQTTDLKKAEDKFAGIDYKGLTKDKHIVSLSSRIQWYPKKEYLREYYPFNSYTLRCARYWNGKKFEKVDYFNKLEAILKDYSYPVYHSEAYLTNRGEKSQVLSLGLCKTKDLLSFIQKGKIDKDYDLREVRKDGDADFYAIYFGKSYFQKKNNYPIFNKSIKVFINKKPKKKINKNKTKLTIGRKYK